MLQVEWYVSVQRYPFIAPIKTLRLKLVQIHVTGRMVCQCAKISIYSTNQNTEIKTSPDTCYR